METTATHIIPYQHCEAHVPVLQRHHSPSKQDSSVLMKTFMTNDLMLSHRTFERIICKWFCVNFATLNFMWYFTIIASLFQSFQTVFSMVLASMLFAFSVCQFPHKVRLSVSFTKVPMDRLLHVGLRQTLQDQKRHTQQSVFGNNGEPRSLLSYLFLFFPFFCNQKIHYYPLCLFPAGVGRLKLGSKCNMISVTLTKQVTKKTWCSALMCSSSSHKIMIFRRCPRFWLGITFIACIIGYTCIWLHIQHPPLLLPPW